MAFFYFCSRQNLKGEETLFIELSLVCGIKGTLKDQNDSELIVYYMSPSDSPDHPGSILYRSESSEVPYSTNQLQLMKVNPDC